MVNALFPLLLCFLGLQADARPAPGDLLVIATLGTPCLPAAHAQISLPGLEGSTVADSLGQASFPSVPTGDLQILITHFGAAALGGTVHVAAGEAQVVLADLRSRELRIVRIIRPSGAVRPLFLVDIEGETMSFRVVPVDRAVAEEVRRTGKAPGYGHPAYQIDSRNR